MKLWCIINLMVAVLIWYGCTNLNNSSKQNIKNDSLSQDKKSDPLVADETFNAVEFTFDSISRILNLSELTECLKNKNNIDSIQQIYSLYESIELRALCPVFFKNKILKFSNNKPELWLGDGQYLLGILKAESISKIKVLYFLDVIEDLSSRGVFMLTVDNNGRVIDYEYLFSKGGDGGNSFETELNFISHRKFKFEKVEKEYISEKFDTMIVIKTLGVIQVDFERGFIQREIKEIKKDTIF